MTSAARPPGNRSPWYIKPGIVLPAVAAILILIAVLSPDQSVGRAGSSRLTTFSAQPQGARLFMELAQRLGWQVERRRTAALPSDPRAIHAVLAARIQPRVGEVHALLEHVRAGGALLVALSGPDDPFADSLRMA